MKQGLYANHGLRSAESSLSSCLGQLLYNGGVGVFHQTVRGGWCASS